MLHQVYDAIWNAIANQQNQFLQGGIVLMIIGTIGAYARRLPSRLYHWILNRFIITLEISNEDPAFDWLTGWLSMQPYSKRSRNLTVTTYRDSYGNLRQRGRRNNNGPSVACSPGEREPEPQLPEIIFTPAPGNHVFLYKRRPVWLVRSKESPKSEEGGYSFFTRESFQIRMFARNQDTARALIEEAQKLSLVEKEVRTDIYVFDRYNGMRRIDSCDPRPISTVFLPEGQVAAIKDSIQQFLGQQSFYQRRGIPWRLGLLFHGLPGTGKTTLIRALSGEFRMDLYLISLSGAMSDSALSQALGNVPPRSIILLEDVDATFVQRDKNQDVENTLSFSGLLNALDGVASREGWVVFMTTNHIEKLDPALIRPGRADIKLEFKHATAYQAASMYEAFFPEGLDPDASLTFGVIVENRKMIMAEVQQHLIVHQHSAVEALGAMSLPAVVEEVA